MRDLKSAASVASWPMLKRKIEREGFPLGFLLGPNSRGWTEEEVAAWIASRPTGGPTPRGIALANLHKARAKRARSRGAGRRPDKQTKSENEEGPAPLATVPGRFVLDPTRDRIKRP